jgi:hypothetical protein
MEYQWIHGRNDSVHYEDGGAVWYNLYDRQGLVYKIIYYYGEHWEHIGEDIESEYVLCDKDDKEIMTWPATNNTPFEDIATLAEEIIKDLEKK